MTAALLLADIGKSYRRPNGSDVDVVRNFDLTVETGESVAIVGASGSGKSTVLRIAGLLTEPTAGRIAIGGQRVTGESEDGARTRLEKIGYIFQEFRLLAHLTALENVMEAFRFSAVGRSERRSRARTALQDVGLGHRIDHRPSHLSGGEQQRVAIARAVVKKPDLVLADEPTGNLDAATTRSIMNELRDVTRDAALVMVTHDESIARDLGRTIRIGG